MAQLVWPAIASARNFTHPGVLVDRAQLDFIKLQITAGRQPWKAAYGKVLASSLSSLAYSPKPRATVECGSYSIPDYGCTDENNDSRAAYTHALLWYLTGDHAHADKAIAIMNAWSGVLKAHTNRNAPLQSAWAASMFPRAGEIIRYTGAGWAQADIARFSDMLRNAYLPYIRNGSGANGNWELSMIEAMMGIGVFLDSVPLFDRAASMWRKRVPAYIYLSGDGAFPLAPPTSKQWDDSQIVVYWQGQTTFRDGLSHETCRDFYHTSMGFASAINAAETARLQGVDLYAEEGNRLMAGLEFHAGYQTGTPIPAWLCGGKLNLGTTATWEIAYNHYHNRKGANLPNTQRLVEKLRPTGSAFMTAWETLTHAESGSVAVDVRPERGPGQSRPVRIGILVLDGQRILIRRPGRKELIDPQGKISSPRIAPED